MASENIILVCGSSGTIGRALANHLTSQGRSIIRTTRRGDAGSIALDLNDLGSWKLPGGISIAYLCAAVTSTAACWRNPSEARAVNVTATLRLAEALMQKGAFVVYLSSNLVFDGSSPTMKADAPFSPCVEYGREKADVEKRLLHWGDRCCIVRLTKVLAPGNPLLLGWRDDMRLGREVHPYFDMVMSPISIGLVADVLSRLARTTLSGVLQLSALHDITYEQAARHIAERCGASQSLIRPLSATGKVEHPMAHTSLDATRMRDELGVAIPSPWCAIDLLLDSV